MNGCGAFRGRSQNDLIAVLAEFDHDHLARLTRSLGPAATSLHDRKGAALRDAVVELHGDPDAYDVLCGLLLGCEIVGALRLSIPARTAILGHLLTVAGLFATNLERAGLRGRFDEIVSDL